MAIKRRRAAVDEDLLRTKTKKTEFKFNARRIYWRTRFNLGNASEGLLIEFMMPSSEAILLYPMVIKRGPLEIACDLRVI